MAVGRMWSDQQYNYILASFLDKFGTNIIVEH